MEKAGMRRILNVTSWVWCAPARSGQKNQYQQGMVQRNYRNRTITKFFKETGSIEKYGSGSTRNDNTSIMLDEGITLGYTKL